MSDHCTFKGRQSRNTAVVKSIDFSKYVIMKIFTISFYSTKTCSCFVKDYNYYERELLLFCKFKITSSLNFIFF